MLYILHHHWCSVLKKLQETNSCWYIIISNQEKSHTVNKHLQTFTNLPIRCINNMSFEQILATKTWRSSECDCVAKETSHTMVPVSGVIADRMNLQFLEPFCHWKFLQLKECNPRVAKTNDYIHASRFFFRQILWHVKTYIHWGNMAMWHEFNLPKKIFKRNTRFPNPKPPSWGRWVWLLQVSWSCWMVVWCIGMVCAFFQQRAVDSVKIPIIPMGLFSQGQVNSSKWVELNSNNSDGMFFPNNSRGQKHGKKRVWFWKLNVQRVQQSWVEKLQKQEVSLHHLSKMYGRLLFSKNPRHEIPQKFGWSDFMLEISNWWTTKIILKVEIHSPGRANLVMKLMQDFAPYLVLMWNEINKRQFHIIFNVKRVDCWHWQINLEINKKCFFCTTWQLIWFFWYSSSSTQVDIPCHLRSDLSENSQFWWNSTKMQKDWYQIQANVNSAEEMWTREAIFCLKLWTEVKAWSL